MATDEVAKEGSFVGFSMASLVALPSGALLLVIVECNQYGADVKSIAVIPTALTRLLHRLLNPRFFHRIFITSAV